MLLRNWQIQLFCLAKNYWALRQRANFVVFNELLLFRSSLPEKMSIRHGWAVKCYAGKYLTRVKKVLPKKTFSSTYWKDLIWAGIFCQLYNHRNAYTAEFKWKKETKKDPLKEEKPKPSLSGAAKPAFQPVSQPFHWLLETVEAGKEPWKRLLPKAAFVHSFVVCLFSSLPLRRERAKEPWEFEHLTVDSWLPEKDPLFSRGCARLLTPFFTLPFRPFCSGMQGLTEYYQRGR